MNEKQEIARLRDALTRILNLGQETCVTHEDQCIATTRIVQQALGYDSLQIQANQEALARSKRRQHHRRRQRGPT